MFKYFVSVLQWIKDALIEKHLIYDIWHQS